MALSENIEEMEFDWVQLHQDMEKYAKTETSQEKLMRKLKQNPVVPIGALTTTAILSYGLWCFRTGNREMSQIMMRSRVAAQGFTVLAFVVGLGMSARKMATESTEENSYK